MTRRCILTTKNFRTYLPAHIFDVPMWQFQRWHEKGLAKYTKDGWVEIRSKHLLEDVREEPELIEFVLNDWNKCLDVTALNLHDCFREQQWKAELRAEGRSSEIEAMEWDGTMNSDADLNKWIRRYSKTLDKLETEANELSEIQQAYKTKLQEASVPAASLSIVDKLNELAKVTMVVETLDASKVA